MTWNTSLYEDTVSRYTHGFNSWSREAYMVSDFVGKKYLLSTPSLYIDKWAYQNLYSLKRSTH